MRNPSVIIIGAGVGGLVTAIDLARNGAAVTVLESGDGPGGKMRPARIGDALLDAGPTVLTMRAVFEEIFADAGADLAASVTLRPAGILARHAWSGDERLDLFSDIDRSADAIGVLAGAAEARGYRGFCARAARVFATLEPSFIRARRPTALSLAAGAGLRGLKELWGVSPFATLWQALGEHFRDPRLRQLFGRYATYSGSSPFAAPATLMLIADVERQGVWLVDGGMARLAAALADLATGCGAVIRYGAPVREIMLDGRRAGAVRLADGERLGADAIVVNGDSAALATGAFGPAVVPAVPRLRADERSLSAVTWTMLATGAGFPLTRHNVFFSRDYAAEFDEIFGQTRLPTEPTVYVCAQDRESSEPHNGAERFLVLVNAPAIGDRHHFTQAEIEQCARRTFGVLERCGLTLTRDPAAEIVTTPTEFATRFPATGGALYGRAVHGSMAAFRRPASRSTIPGLYLAGGSVHPGPGVPMAALSGRLAAASVLADHASMSPSRPMVMRGGMSMR